MKRCLNKKLWCIIYTGVVIPAGCLADGVLDHVDLFWGQAGVDLPPPQGVAATWNWEKAQTGNTHPGPQLPFGMVSVVPYTGGYPSGVGYNHMTSHGPARYIPGYKNTTTGFTHFQHAGTGNVGFFYNYLRVCPVEKYDAQTRNKR